MMIGGGHCSADSAIVAMKEEEEGNDGSRNNGMAQGVIINNTNNSSSNCDNNGYWDRPNGEMDITRTLRTGRRHSTSLISAESALDHQDPSLYCGNLGRQPRSDSPPMQALASGAQHSESSAAYFLWPVSSRLHGTAEERTAYFNGLQKDVASELEERIPSGQQASTLLDLMTIRAFHSKRLRRFSLGTAIGFRTRGGVLTNIPAILVFVARKVHKEWLHDIQRLPSALEGPGGVWCDVDVVEFSYYGASAVTPKEQVYTELVEGLRGNDPCIGPGSQVASQETYGTLGAIVQSRTGARQVGFLTNRHVAVDLDYPNQKMFHPLPPNLGPGVYLGAVERATSFITDDLWYGIFASTNPETFVRADGAFIPFGDRFDAAKVTTNIKGVGEMGDVMVVDLQAPISSVVGKQVTKVGRSSGLTKGSVMAYALEYNDEKGICFLTDFLIVGENKQAFDLEGDSGSLILMTGEGNGKPRPVGIIWGGTANRGRLKLHNGHAPENWTSGVDLGRLLDLLQLALITNDDALSEAFEEQRRWATAVGGGSNVGESFPRAMGIVMERERVEGSHGAGAQGLPGFNLGSQHQHQHQHHHHQLEGSHEELLTRVVSLPGILNDADPLATASSSPPSMELLLMNDSVGLALHKPAEVDAEDMSPNDGDDLSFGLNLFDMDTKRRRQSKS